MIYPLYKEVSEQEKGLQILSFVAAFKWDYLFILFKAEKQNDVIEKNQKEILNIILYNSPSGKPYTTPFNNTVLNYTDNILCSLSEKRNKNK